MSNVEFFRTGMGHTFYEGTMPRIASALERIAKALEEANKPKQSAVPGVHKCSACGAWEGHMHRSGFGCPVEAVDCQERPSTPPGQNEYGEERRTDTAEAILDLLTKRPEV